MGKLDCDLSRSDRNLLQRIFNRKKGVKTTRFKDDNKGNVP
jgi:penicillin-binding protein 1A